MNTLEDILTTNGFELNENFEAVYTIEFDSKDDVYEMLEYIKQRSSIDVFVNINEELSIADFFFQAQNHSPDIIEHTVNLIINA